MSALLDSLRAAVPLKTETIPVGGTSFRIRELSLADRDTFLAAQKEGKKVGPLLMSLCVVNDAGIPEMIGEEEEITRAFSPSVIDEVAIKVLALSGFSSKND